MNKIQIQQKNSAINFTEKSNRVSFTKLNILKIAFQQFDLELKKAKRKKRKLAFFQSIKWGETKNVYRQLKQIKQKKNIKFTKSIFIRANLKLQINQYKLNQNMFEQNFDDQENRTGESPPNNTIYINNLNEKVPIDELKDTLYNIFEEYGEILDIIAKKNIRMRGQAFVIYRDINSAMEAKRKLNGKELYGKTMRCHFARQKSDVISKIDGTFQIRQKPENYFQMKFQEKFVRRPQQILKAKVQREKNILKKTDNSTNPPNHILFCEGLNASISKEKLIDIFVRFPGLKDVRLAPKNIAFIEYEDEFKAGTALAALNQTTVGDTTLKLTYAKK